MATSAEIRAMLYAAADKLQRANAVLQGQVRTNVTDTSVSLNNATDTNRAVQGGMLSTLSELRAGMQQARLALTGSSNANATGALVWLDRVDQNLEDDLLKIRNLENELKSKNLELIQVQTNVQENITHIIGAISELVAHANTRV